MNYMTISEASKKWGISPRRIQVLCNEGRIAGAEHFGHAWAIPDETEKPVDARIRTGKYIKKRQQMSNTWLVVSQEEKNLGNQIAQKLFDSTQDINTLIEMIKASPNQLQNMNVKLNVPFATTLHRNQIHIHTVCQFP